MANIVPYSFQQELFKGGHNFANGGSTYYVSLYTANPYTTASTVFSGVDEVSSGSGSLYAALQLQNQAVANQSNVATVDWTTNPSWGPGATFAAAFGAIYKFTGNVANDLLVVVLDFNGTKSCSNGTFTITFPAPASGTPAGSGAILSITGPA